MIEMTLSQKQIWEV